MAEGRGLHARQICTQEARLMLLESEVKELREGQDREEAFRKTYYADREARIRRDTELDGKLNAIGNDLSAVKAWVTGRQQEPGRRWDRIVERVVGLLVAAVVGLLLARLGL